jgi:hypothetical protein
MTVDVKIDTQEFDRALIRFGANSRKSSSEILRNQGKLFVRDIIRITPPFRGYDKGGKALGESAIRHDIGRALRQEEEGGDAAKLHAAARNDRGRVRKNVVRQPALGVAAHLKAMLARVGLLASGWNAAAAELGAAVPAWIKRHGTSRGQCEVITSGPTFKIRISNAVRFVGSVNDLSRRVQWSLNNRARQMDKQVDNFAVKKASRAAGFK